MATMIGDRARPSDDLSDAGVFPAEVSLRSTLCRQAVWSLPLRQSERPKAGKTPLADESEEDGRARIGDHRGHAGLKGGENFAFCDLFAGRFVLSCCALVRKILSASPRALRFANTAGTFAWFPSIASPVAVDPRELFTGKNRQAIQRACRPKAFCLSITPGPLHSICPLSRRIWHVVRCSWLCICAVACVNLEVMAQGGFDSTDSANLANCRRLLSAIAHGNYNTVSPDAPNLFGRVTDIWTVLHNVDFEVLADDVTAIRHEASFASTKLTDIDNTLVEISGKMDDMIISISNAIARLPLSSVLVTNFVTGSGAVDLGIVSNIFAQITMPYGIYHDGISLDQVFSSFGEFVYQYPGISQTGPKPVRYMDFLAQSSFGLILALMDSALISQNYGPNSVWSRARDYWFADGSRDGRFKYSIFEAYNTIGITNLLSQIAVTNAGIYQTLQGQNNFLFHSLQYITNSLAKITNISKVGDTVTMIYTQNLEMTQYLTNSIGDPDDSEVDLDYEEDLDKPEWQPKYVDQLDVATNYSYYSYPMESVMEGMFKGRTNKVVELANKMTPQAGEEFSETLSWSGVRNKGHYSGSWTMPIKLGGGSAIRQTVGNLISAVYNILIYTAHLVVFLYYARRIVKFVTRPFPL